MARHLFHSGRLAPVSQQLSENGQAMAEAEATGLPLSDVLAHRQRWAEAQAARMIRAAVAEMDRISGRVPDDFERREDPRQHHWGDPRRRWYDVLPGDHIDSGMGGGFDL